MSGSPSRGILLVSFLVTLVIAVPLLTGAMVAPPKVTPPRIVEPMYSRPYAAEPGGHVNVTIVGAGSVESVELASFNYTAELNFTVALGEGDTITVTVTLPDDLDEGLYDLIVYTDAGRAWMPRAVWVPGDLACITIMQMSDVHFGASDKGIPNTPKNTKYIMLANTLAEQAGVDMVVITGDIADVGSDVESLRAIYMQYNQFRIPTFMVPGNHDWAQVPGKDAFLNSYYGLYINSKQYWYRVVGPYLVIGLDSLGDGYVSMEQLDFLEEVLERYPDKKAIIAFHHSVFTRSGEYTGDLRSFLGSIYSSWRERPSNLERFMEIVRGHDNVVLVLSGHIHRDEYAIVDDRIHFVTTTTANHGTPTYWGFKLVSVCENGTVNVILPPGKSDPFSGRVSFNTEYIDSYEYVGSDHKVVIWDLHASRFAEVNLSNAVLLFYVNASIPAEQYKFYGDTDVIRDVEYYTYGDYHVFKVYASVPTDRRAVIVLAPFKDEEPPSVRITLVNPRNPLSTSSILVYVAANDGDGWGVRSVKLYVDKGQGWEEAGELRSQGGYYVGKIGPFKPGVVKIKAVAVDYAGNQAESDVVEVRVRGQQPTTETTTTPTPTETPEATTTPPEEPEEAETTTTPPPETETTASPPTTEPASPASPAAPATTTTTPGAAAGAGSQLALVVAVVVGLIVVAAMFILARRS